MTRYFRRDIRQMIVCERPLLRADQVIE